MALRRKTHPGDSPIRGFPALILLMILAVTTQAAQFAGGTGDPNNPYQIATAEQLIAIGPDPTLLDKHYILIADIDLASGRPDGWIFSGAVIGTFSGSFDGANHTIRNLAISSKAEGSLVGLFSRIDVQARVSSLLLRPVSIQCPNAWQVGALAGENWGTLVNCRVNGSVFGTDCVGGLVGQNLGTIRGCSADCWVEGQMNVGGLVGGDPHTYYSPAAIECCTASGTVIGKADVGGLVGFANGALIDCFATAFVVGEDYVGGLAGECALSSVIHCYACGPVIGAANRATIGALIGSSLKSDLQACYFLAPVGAASQINGLGTPLTDAQMRDPASFVGWDFTGPVEDGFGETWMMGEGDGYPLLSLIGGYEPPRPPGQGTADDPFQISRLEDFSAMFWMPDAHYRLVADVNFAGLAVIGPVIPSFEGRFDGAGHSLLNLHITGKQGGFFGTIEPGGIVENLRLENTSLEGMPEVSTLGILTGTNAGLVRNCHVTGSVTGANILGGLVGTNKGVLWACGADVSVRGAQRVGGLVGVNERGTALLNKGQISQCYSSGQVTAEFGGGLVGANDGDIGDCFSTTSVAKGEFTAGFAASNTGVIRRCYSTGLLSEQRRGWGFCTGRGTTELCFWDVQTSGVSANGAGSGRTTEQMRQAATFAGWDFENVWTICEGRGYPRLRWEGVACDEGD